jgi:hypothetical protein
MHCDDKRTLFVLKQGIEETWEELKKNNFSNEDLIKQLSEEIQEYFEYKIHPQIRPIFNSYS